MTRRSSIVRGTLLAIVCSLLGGCAAQKKDAEEAARNTFACNLEGERFVIRFDGDEARMLMPSGDRVTLYQIPSAPPAVRFTNGRMELRGRGTTLELVRDGTLSSLVGCAPFAPPA